jgi:glycosyltransferase involved in cell wall biosynthesis
MEKKISVVIPTYNRPYLLNNCLKALANQTLISNDYEIIVVSDGHDMNTEKVINQFRAEQNVELFFYSLPSKKGPAAARNLGWQNANGHLIAFTDDDCLPDTNWLHSIWLMYNNEELVAYTGKVTVPISEKPSDFALNTAGLETAEFVTANCICTKNALHKTGGFDEKFSSAWREDSDLHFKLMLNNIPIHKNNKAVVVHPVRKVNWGISIKEQKKSMFNALLYKKYPELYRQRIKATPTWSYYTMILLFITSIVALFFKDFMLAKATLLVWIILTIWLTTKRLSKTTKSVSHIFEMFITSMIIPFVSVYWTLYGAWKYRVMFL